MISSTSSSSWSPPRAGDRERARASSRDDSPPQQQQEGGTIVPTEFDDATRVVMDKTETTAAASLLHDGEVEDGTCAICLDTILEADVAMVGLCTS